MSNESPTVFLTEVSFEYAVELGTNAASLSSSLFTSHVVEPLEERILDIVANDMNCDSSRRQMQEDNANDAASTSSIVLIDSSPADTPSVTHTCSPTKLPKTGKCTVMNGRMIIGFSDENSKLKAIHDILAIIRKDMMNESFLSPSLNTKLLALRYIGPDPEDIIMVTPTTTTNNTSKSSLSSADSSSSDPFIKMVCAGAAIVTFVLTLCFVKRRIRRQEEEWEVKFNEARGANTTKSIGSGESDISSLEKSQRSINEESFNRYFVSDANEEIQSV